MKKYWLRSGYFLLVCALLSFGWAGFTYLQIDPQALRGNIEYIPPNQQFTRHAGLGNPDNIPLDAMPLHMIFVTFSAEDYRFSVHSGIRTENWWLCIKRYLTGGTLCGGSSLTQQIAKNLVVGWDRTLYRKLRELVAAYKMEQHFSKAELFTLYANMAETGPGIYGYPAAARYYFDKDIKDITLAEAAFIVSNLSHPTRNSRWFIEKTYNQRQINFMRYIIFNAMIFEREIFGDTGAPADIMQQDPFPLIAKNFPKIKESWEYYSKPDNVIAQRMQDDAQAQLDAFLYRYGIGY